MQGTEVKQADQARDPICLDQFLKRHSIAETGGQAKVMIQSGEVKLNGVVETRRRKKLAVGDVIEIGNTQWTVPETNSQEA